MASFFKNLQKCVCFVFVNTYKRTIPGSLYLDGKYKQVRI